LWSVIQGEQLEFGVVLDFVYDLANGYVFEAVVVESANMAMQTSPPDSIQPGGKTTLLEVFQPTISGQWNANEVYLNGEIVSWKNSYYVQAKSSSYAGTVEPQNDSNWTPYVNNQVYLRMLSTLSMDWQVQPTPHQDVYGFIELRVTEAGSTGFLRTWKPLRGMMKISYSPTEGN
jgi:hypothetical protein